jgi:6-phospho-beta-glucosidase
MKIAVIGGGSTYTPELVNGFLNNRTSFPLSELCLMDINASRLEVVGGFARRMVAARGDPFRLTLSQDQRQAVQGAAYVITQLRVGMMEARRADEYLGQRHNLIGQETTGVGGMSKALRTIPVILKIAEDMRQLAPGALLVNFTNPSGLVTQALSQVAPDVPSVGVCNAPYHAQMDMLAGLEQATGEDIDPARTRLNTLGLNHLSWHRGFTLDGEEMWPQVLDNYLAGLRQETAPEFAPLLVETLKLIPNYYLGYFYQTGQMLAEQNSWPPSRAEEVMELEKDLLAQYADPVLVEPPADLMKRGGAYYSTVATNLINAHYNDLGETHVVNTRHAGAVRGWPEDWVLELPCQVDRSGIHPLPAEPLPPVCFGLLAQVKSYELLTIEAAIHGDRQAAYQALLAHPLGPPADQIQAALDDMLATHRAYLPQF